MGKFNLNFIFKIISLIMGIYLLFLLTKYVNAVSEKDRYIKGDLFQSILDTKTGIYYYYKNGEKIEYRGESMNGRIR